MIGESVDTIAKELDKAFEHVETLPKELAKKYKGKRSVKIDTNDDLIHNLYIVPKVDKGFNLPRYQEYAANDICALFCNTSKFVIFQISLIYINYLEPSNI
jgi:hypothetical protein